MATQHADGTPDAGITKQTPEHDRWTKDQGKTPGELSKTQFDAPISDGLYSLLTSTESVSSLLAKDPSMTPGEAWHKLYNHHVGKLSGPKVAESAGRIEPSREILERAAACGKWGPTTPSALFLQVYSDAIYPLHENPGHGMVSPPLMGSCGVLPLTVLSIVPDIMRHMSNVIVRAEREVFLATNYWANSTASKYITNAMRELSRRAGERGTKIVFKIIYDRAGPKQLVKPHSLVEEKEWTNDKVNLPPRHDIPNIDLQVMNYHQPMLGTFHAKYMVVDRKIAILQSNNIQDNDNVEMMTHLEGPIVDSMYDMALLSWDKALDPPLPSHNTPAAQGGLGSFADGKHNDIFGPNGSIRGHSAVVDGSNATTRASYAYDQSTLEPGRVDEHKQGAATTDDTNRSDVTTGPSTTASILPMRPAGQSSQGTEQVNSQVQPQGVATHTQDASGAHPTATTNRPDGPDPSTAAFLNDGAQAMPQAVISEPQSGEQLPEHLATDPHYDTTIAGEVLRVQSSVSARPGMTRVAAVNKHLNHTTNLNFGYDAPDFTAHDEMTPYIPHKAHEPFPIAMVCRSPFGSPSHKSISMPQNAAWLSSLRNAKKNVFIQSPTLNAEPLLPAIVDACNRGIDVYCYICLGYNDTGELLPGQGGHNDMVAHHLYSALTDPAAKARLHYFWYVGKDQTKPIHQSKKHRSCHVKLMVVDEHIGIMGNGNQDTQSWYHSQEINIMLDSRDVCKAWIDGLRRNQNTHLYGAFNKEKGVWLDKNGKEAEGAIGVDPGKFAWAKGFVGAIKRVQGVGGF